MPGNPVPINSPAVLNRAKDRRLVTVYLHTDRYQGKCKLIPVKPSPAGPKEYVSADITAGETKGVWGAAFPDEDIPEGSYVLEVPLKGGTVPSVRQLVNVDHAYRNVMGVSADDVKTRATSGQILHEPLIGDGYSLEEALVHLFAYKFGDGIGTLLKNATGEKESGGEAAEHQKAYATLIGVTKAMHDRVSSAIGVVDPGNEYYKNFHKIWQVVEEKPKSWKSLKESSVKAAGDAGGEKYEEAVKRWGFEEWGEKVGKVSSPVEVLGTVLDAYETFDGIAGFYGAFQEADAAAIEFLSAIGTNYDSRKDWRNLEPWFSRGDLILLETSCQNADNRAGKAQVEGLGFSGDMLGLMIGVVFPEGFIAEVFGAKAAKVLDVLGWIKSGAETFDEFAFNATLGNRCGAVKEWWSDTGARSHNSNAIFHSLVGRSTSNWDRCEYALAFLYRAKVLYGLMDLIGRCGSYEKDPGAFRTKASNLKIREYIDSFVLRSHFWVRNDHLTVDWVEHFHLQKSVADRDEVVRFSSPSKDGSASGGWERWGGLGWTKVDFQRFFPIHFVDNKETANLARDFSSDYSGVKESDVEKTFWQVASTVKTTRATTADGAEDVNVEVTEWRTLKHWQQIDSETPVRAVLVVKSSADIRTGTPVTFQLYRVDWRNVAGPTVSTVVRRGDPRDRLPGLVGRKVAIATFDYAYTWKGRQPSTVYQGIKPMAGTCHEAKPQAMHMAVWWTIGHNEGQAWLADGQEIELLPYSSAANHPGIYDREFNDRNEAKFKDAAFLARESSTEEYSADVPKSDVIVRVQVGKGGDAWDTLAPGGDDTVVTFGQPVRVVITVKKRKDRKEGIPAAVQLIRTDGGNAAGPVYRSEKMAPLDAEGFKGEWGVVLPLFFYVLDGADMQAARVEGIKPIHRGSTTNYMNMDFRGFTFDLRYRVGDSWGSKIWSSWSEWETAKPDDVRFDMSSVADSFRGYAGQPIPAFVFDGDEARRKAILLNVSLNRRHDTLGKMVSTDLIHPDILTEGK